MSRLIKSLRSTAEEEAIEAKIEATQARLLEVQFQIDQTLATARTLLIRAADEARQLRAEAERFNLKVFTEKEAASELKMSAAMLARLRRSKRLPHFRAGTLVGYSNKHLVEIVEILEARPRGKPKP